MARVDDQGPAIWHFYRCVACSSFRAWSGVCVRVVQGVLTLNQDWRGTEAFVGKTLFLKYDLAPLSR